jgi:class 3 adenylate cyclase
MSKKQLMDDITADVKDIISTDFTFYKTRAVPNSEDSNLTFERGAEKKGKSIETCVLYVDIRNSVALSQLNINLMGKIYTAFIKGVIKAADHHSGYIRNIIGDRVMVVFSPKGCVQNAVNCAITINHLSKYIINEEFSGVNFKCGIGIDFGRIRVIKVGVTKYGKERIDNKNLVWVGRPANIASRLTDIANKTVTKEYYSVRFNPFNPRKFLGSLFGERNTFTDLLNKSDTPQKDEPLYLLHQTQTKELNSSEFAASISKYNHENSLFYSGGNLIDYEKRNKKVEYKPILITNEVYKGLKKELPKDISIVNNWWHKQDVEVTDYNGDIWGSGLTWKLN